MRSVLSCVVLAVLAVQGAGAEEARVKDLQDKVAARGATAPKVDRNLRDYATNMPWVPVENATPCAKYGRKANICQKLKNAGAPCEWLAIPDRGQGNCAGSYGCHSMYAGCNSYTCEQTCNQRADCEWRGGKCQANCGMIGERCEMEYEFTRRLSTEPEEKARDLTLLLKARKGQTERSLQDADGWRFGGAKSTCCANDQYGGQIACLVPDEDGGKGTDIPQAPYGVGV